MTKHVSIDAIRHGREAAAAYSDEALAELAEQIEAEEIMTKPRVEAGDRASRGAQNAELKRQQSKYDCQTCNDKGFVRINGTDRVAPCPKCNEDGMDGISG